MKCPGCGKESQGRFCSHCGTPLQAGHCDSCGAKLQPGTRFCTQCGAKTGAAPAARARAAGNENLGWYVAAGVLVVLIAVIAAGMLLDRGGTSPGAGAPGGAVAPMAGSGGTGAPGPLTGSPREQADRLFNRIMTAREAGDTGQVKMFMPMALQAYRGLPDLDGDGLFHLSMLETVGGEPDAALATANRILASNPNHLLGLATAAEAALAKGDQAAARGFWQRYLDAWETERGKSLQEYLDHASLLPEYEASARKAVGR